MVSLNDKELEKLHKIHLEMLKDIDDFCKKNNITYFLAEGSMLGAIRHKGFIPWDDDLDIGMMRSDYEKFIKLYSEDKNRKYYIDSMETNPGYWLPFAKIRKPNTLFLEKRIENVPVNKDIYIDVFPYDNVPNAGYKKVIFRANIIKIMEDSIHIKMKITKIKEVRRHKILACLFNILSKKTLYKIQKKLMTKYDNQDTDYITCYVTVYPTSRECMKREDFLPVKKVKFENLEVNVINKPEVALERIYGDYMKLPPVEKRGSHDIIAINFENGDLNE